MNRLCRPRLCQRFVTGRYRLSGNHGYDIRQENPIARTPIDKEVQPHGDVHYDVELDRYCHGQDVRYRPAEEYGRQPPKLEDEASNAGEREQPPPRQEEVHRLPNER